VISFQFACLLPRVYMEHYRYIWENITVLRTRFRTVPILLLHLAYCQVSAYLSYDLSSISECASLSRVSTGLDIINVTARRLHDICFVAFILCFFFVSFSCNFLDVSMRLNISPR